MAWVKKASAPDYFSLADAFLALITGDPIWGWLVDWMTLVPNTGTETAAFCAEGPIFTEPLVLTDFIPSSNPLDPRQAVHTAALAYRIAAAARDRVFGAYCEQPAATGVGAWSAPECITGTTAAAYNALGFSHIPAAATRIRCYISNYSSTGGPIQGAFRCGDDPVTVGTTVHAWAPADGSPMDFPVPAAPYNETTWFEWQSAGTTATVCFTFFGVGLGAPEEHDPVEQPQPDGVSSPLRTVDPSLVGIALEAERLELKLDWLLSWVRGIAAVTLDAGGDELEPVEVVADVPVEVGDAVGCVITTTGIPASRSLDFGTPQNIVRLAHVNCGTADAWYPSIWLTHSPFILRPFPLGTTRITVTDLPPGASSSVALISRLK